MTFVDRVGACLVAPRRALAAAEAGQGGMPDALWLLLLKIVCTETPLLVSTLWGLVVLGPRTALSVLAARLGSVIGTDLLLLAAGGALVTLFAGRRRDTTRDFDLAAVAWVPVLAVDTVATLAARLGHVEVGGLARTVVWGAALAWMLIGCTRAVDVARARTA